MPFLNSCEALPSPRASLGSWLPPNSSTIATTTMTMIPSTPKISASTCPPPERTSPALHGDDDYKVRRGRRGRRRSRRSVGEQLLRRRGDVVHLGQDRALEG